VKLLEAGTELRLTRSASADSFPAWSPDGRYIAFFREGLGASGYYIVSARGGPERRIPGEASSSSVGLDWSPDGKSLIVSEMSEKSQASPLVMISIDTGQRRTVTSPPKSSMGDLYPQFSPDGQWLAYIRVLAYGNADIWVTPAKGGISRPLTADQAWKEQFSWLPDSRGIVFPVLQPSTGGLWQISLAGEGARAITPDGQEMAMPTLARRGHRLAYVLSTTSINLWRIDIAAAGRPNILVPREFIVSTRRQFDPQYSPDGKVIAFLSDRSGSEEIWTAEAEGERPLQLTHFSGPPTGSPSWSPDGSEIAFDTRANGNPDIWVVKRYGGVPQRITNSHAEDVVPSWSHDGRWIYFASNRGGDFQIWKVARAGESPSHPAVQVTKHGGFCSMETPDGKYLYFSKGRGHDGLWRRSTDTEDGKEEPIVRSLQHWGWWTLAPQGILFFEENGASVRLMLSDLLGLLSRPIGHWNASLMKATRVMAVTPDGGRVAYAQIDQGGADIMAIENFRSP
jgi:Tol biopolymer transport system component